MRHNVAGRKLKRTASHRRALLANLATSLFEHKRLVTTVAKAKELRPFAEHLITRARNAYNGEKAGIIQGVDVHGRRMVARFIKNKAVLQELFDTIAPLVASRNGGYTRIIKLGARRGDAATEAMIELVDWSNPVDGRSSTTARRTRTAKPEKVVAPKAVVAASATVVPEEPVVDEVAEVVPEVIAEAATEQEAPIAEPEASAENNEAEAAPGDGDDETNDDANGETTKA
jgi:large subunit ribosomal protein L17